MSSPHPFTLRSLLLTVLVAAVAGVLSVTWHEDAAPRPGSEPLPRSVACFTETIEVVAPAEDPDVTLEPARIAQPASQDLVLAARGRGAGAARRSGG